MAGPLQTRETEIIDAIADNIVARTSLVPQTVLSAPSSAGGHILNLTSVDGWQERGYVHFFDDTGEFMAAIDAIDPVAKTLTLDYTGYAEHGLTPNLAFDHSVGAVVATNMMLHRPMAIGSMLNSGLSVVAVWPRRKRTREHTVGSTRSPIVIRIQTQRSIKQFDSAPMDPEVYNQQQQNACRDDLQAIENALNQNRHLMTRYNSPGAHAEGLGDGNGTNNGISEALWDVVVENIDIPQAVGCMDVRVIPRRFVRQEPTQ